MTRLARSSLFPRNARTLALHMAMEAAQRAEVGQRIKELRGPLPQPELARKLNVSLRAVQKWEGGDSAPQWDNLVRLSKFFGVSQNYLLYGEAEKVEPAPSQLDRIEAMLDEVLSRVAALELGASLDVEADQHDERSGRRASAPARKSRSARAS